MPLTTIGLLASDQFFKMYADAFDEPSPEATAQQLRYHANEHAYRRFSFGLGY